QPQVEVDDQADDEHRPLDHHEADRPPPDQPPVAERHRRQRSDVERTPCLDLAFHARASRIVGTGGEGRSASSCRSSRSRARSRFPGQNQPTRVTASGRMATGSAHGVKIEPTKNADVTTAHRNGQIVGSGYSVLCTGSASITSVMSTSRMSLRMPVTIGASALRSHSADRPSTTGTWRKL